MNDQYRAYSAFPTPTPHFSRAEIDLGALKRNYGAVARWMAEKAPNARPIAVVKADAYGHGAPACTKALLEVGCDFFAVASFEEAQVVRRVCDTCQKKATVLILGYTDPCHAASLARLELTQALISPSHARALSGAAKTLGVVLRVHLAVDTGMNRLGFLARSDAEIENTAREILELCSLPHLSVDGVFSHLAAADSPEGSAFTALQYQRYRSLKSRLESLGATIPMHHLSNSAATLQGNTEMLLDGARVGILLYGASPRREESGLSLSPVMKLKSRIVHIHPLPAGEPLGYGCGFCADTPRRIATLPIGYADGFLRAYEGMEVKVLHKENSQWAPLVGRICMDQCMLDVTDVPAEVGDEVVLFGETPDALSRLSAAAHTIDYESLCLISARVPRIYIDSKAPNSQ